jgi:hypothetical protein
MAEKEKVNKITEEQLKGLQEKINLINQGQMQIGGLEMQKTAMKSQVTGVQQELNTMQAELEKEYGKVSINIQDGTYVDIPEEEKAVEDEQADQKN